MADPKKAWERLTAEETKDLPYNETGNAYNAFLDYLETPHSERNLRKTAQNVGSSPSWVSKWSSMFNWKERVQAYDDYMAKRRLELHEETMERAYDEIYNRLVDLASTSVAGALSGEINSAQVAMLRDLLDRGGLKPVERHEVKHAFDEADLDALLGINRVEPDED